VSDFRTEAYRQVLIRSYYLVAWLATAALVARFMGLWALIPGAMALRALSPWLISLLRVSRLPDRS
jgi:hypothetical protein